MTFPTIRFLLTALTFTSWALLPPSLLAAQSAQSPTSAAAQSEGGSRIVLEIGMTGEQMLQLLGKPSAIKNVKNPEVKAEIWLYSYDKLDGVKQVATSMRDVPYFDPLTGFQKTVQEPVYSQERIYLVETTELLVVEGKLAGSKRYRSLKRDIN